MATHGPVRLPRAAVNSATAFFWASVILSAGIGGIRSCAAPFNAKQKTAAKAQAERRSGISRSRYVITVCLPTNPRFFLRAAILGHTKALQPRSQATKL